MARRGMLIGMGLAFLCSALLLYEFHRALILDNPQPSDIIIVPAGDFSLRTSQAVDLARRGYAQTIVIDEGSDTVMFGRTLADRRFRQMSTSWASVQICPIPSGTTVEESKDAKLCLQSSHPRRVLIVTSDFHTRRSLVLFQKQMPDIQFSVSAVPTDYSRQPWWRIESIATAFEEWLALLIWKLQS